jgi:hypothetical protein
MTLIRFPISLKNWWCGWDLTPAWFSIISQRIEGNLKLYKMSNINKTIILDNVFDDNFINDFLEKLNNKNISETWHSLNVFYDNNILFKSLLRKCEKYYDLSNCVGYEFWTQNNTRPSDWHYDKDETFYRNTGNFKFPICSIVYYLKVNNLIGGLLHLEDITIIPKVNRMIIFPPGIKHFVEEFSGERISLLVNPWDYTIKYN